MRRMRTIVTFGSALALAASAAADSATDPTRSLRSELRADAADRTSLLGADGATLKLGGYIQFRYHLNFRDKAPDAVADDPDTPANERVADEDSTLGFQTRRVKLIASGAAAEGWEYYIHSNFASNTGEFSLQDAYVTHKASDAWSVRFGQFKLPYLREESIADSKQLTADRSTMNDTFTQTRSQGAEAAWTGAAVRFRGALSDGLNTLNTDFNGAREADYALTGRLEWKWGSDWNRFEDFTSWRGAGNAGMIGASVHWQDGGQTGGPTADEELLGATADVSFEGNGWNAYAAAVYRQVDPAGGEPADDWGFVVQGGAFLSERWELFGRYDHVMPDNNRGARDGDFGTITAGINFYVIPRSHAVKFTGDVQYYLDDPGESIAPTNAGRNLLADTGDGQCAVRLQFQLIF